MSTSGVNRCSWANSDEMMATYHDSEWGNPVRESQALWETLQLECFQAGLSWSIVLKRRDAFRKSFMGFDPNTVSKFGSEEIEAMLMDVSIIRSRSKIEAVIGNAKAYLEMQSAGEDFSSFAWSYVDGMPIVNVSGEMYAKTALSETISAELKKRGFKFVGPTITYAWMQAVGLVDDHNPGCFRRQS
jgi:DNA-3-methyladenine glycosylase I